MDARQINITLGTAGHIDHGKTALVKLLTGCETDRLKAEKERGMSIDLGFAPCKIANSEVGIVDVPGHEHFIKTMVAGAVGMDAVLLVVAADDGVMPQTREHMDILTLLGVRHGFVALTKIDRVDDEHRELVESDTRAFLQGTFLEDAPIRPISSITGEGFDGFFESLTSLLESLTPRSLDGVFRMPVDRAFSARGHGTVVAGIPVAGSASIEDELVLLPEGRTGSIRQIEVYGRSSDTVKAGQCAAINFRQWDAAAVERGHVITVPGFFTPSEWRVASLRMLAHDNVELKSGAQVKLHTGTTETPATIYPLEGDRVRAGDECLVQFRSASPIVAGPGDHFIIRSLSPVRTVGGGVLLRDEQRRLKRNRPEVLDDLKAELAVIGDERRHVEYVLRRAEAGAADLRSLAVRTKTRTDRVRVILEGMAAEGRAIAVTGESFLHAERAAELADALAASIAEHHEASPSSPGMTLEELRHASGLDRVVLECVLGRMTDAGAISQRSGRWAAAAHKAAFTGEDGKLLEAIDALFRERAFQPPGVDEVASHARIDRKKAEKLLKLLIEHERLVRVEGSLLFHREAVDRARQLLIDYIRKEGRLESVQFKYLLDTTRKFAIPLLDYMDKIGVTRRDGKTRYLREAK